jgi:HPt (histidine-containing phosphotransfer) domain-containing protein
MQPEAREEILDLFVSEAQRLRALMHDTLARGDAEALALAAHSLGGAAAYFDSGELPGTCAQVEQAAKAGDLHAVSRLLPRVDAAVAAAVDKMPVIVGAR